jgi:hypothetical protein
MQRGSRCSRELEYKFVHVTPIPILSGLVGPDHGMGVPHKVFSCVPSRRLITACDVTALLAHTQMDPVQTA